MSSYPTTSDLEVLFIEKLQQKYKLNERDLKKAFSRFDKDNSGLIDIQELGIAVRLMLNGISDEQVRNLVKRFDLNGDGLISYDEFLKYLLSRKDAPTSAANEANDVRFERRNKNSINYKTRPKDDYGGDESVNRSTGVRGNTGKADFRNYEARDDNVEQDNYQNRKSGSRAANQYNRNEAGDEDDDVDDDSIVDNEDDLDDDENYDNYPARAEGRGPPKSFSALTQKNLQRGRNRDSDNASTVSDAPSDVASNFDPGNSSEVEYRCKVFLENLRSLLNKRAISLRDSGALANHLTVSKKELLEKTGCALLTKAFKSFETGTRPRKEDQLIDLGNFMRFASSV